MICQYIDFEEVKIQEYNKKTIQNLSDWEHQLEATTLSG